MYFKTTIFLAVAFFFSCNKNANVIEENSSIDFESNQSIEKVESVKEIINTKETFVFDFNLNNSKIGKQEFIKMSLDSINYSEKLNLFQNQNVNFEYEEQKEQQQFIIETEKCFIKFVSNFSENDSYKVYRDKKSIGNYHFISIEGIDGVASLLINKKLSTYQFFNGETIFNEDKSKFLIMKNDVDYSIIKIFNFENNQINNERNYYSELNFIQNITLIKNKVILKTKLPKSKPQVYEIVN
jgi:hypothetical protein